MFHAKKGMLFFFSWFETNSGGQNCAIGFHKVVERIIGFDKPAECYELSGSIHIGGQWIDEKHSKDIV